MSDDESKSQATLLTELAQHDELFHDSDGVGFATVQRDTHTEIYPVRSKPYRDSLIHDFYREHRKTPGSQAVQDAINALEGKARFDGPEFEVYTRMAETDGNIYLDLCNADWQSIEISPEGWSVVDSSPVKFIRKRGMLPLSVPERGGSIDELWRFINVSSENDKRLIIGFILACLRPTGPFPTLNLQGEQGSGKSIMSRIIRGLCDPSTTPLRTAPKDERDLMIAGRNGWVLCFDNLSGLQGWLSDALCRISTGGGFATRELYSDFDEVMFNVTRPVIVNGIDDLMARPDLVDRALIINLPIIPEHKRLPESKFWADFEQAKPRIIGALLDAVSGALKELPNTTLERLPRMADFALWVTAAEKALNWKHGSFIEAYAGNRQDEPFPI